MQDHRCQRPPSNLRAPFGNGRAANPTLLSPSGGADEVGELKRRVKKLEEAVAALQAVSLWRLGPGYYFDDEFKAVSCTQAS